MAVEINKTILEQQVQEGMKRDELALHYGLPKSTMSKVLKDAGLRIRKLHKPKYVLVDNSVQEEVQGNLENIGTLEESLVSDETSISIFDGETSTSTGLGTIIIPGETIISDSSNILATSEAILEYSDEVREDLKAIEELDAKAAEIDVVSEAIEKELAVEDAVKEDW